MSRVLWRFILFPLLALVLALVVLSFLFGITYTWVLLRTLELLREKPLLGLLALFLEILILFLLGVGLKLIFDKIKSWVKRRSS
ncbi:MAG: hypothetical protein GXO04_05805 [Aquificae bacterium]|nr:hypothetical protein [Aquificota bacterium]